MGMSGPSHHSSGTNRPLSFSTPWQKGLDGNQARLNLQYNDADHTLIISKEKLSRLNPVINFFNNKPREKVKTTTLRAFSNITTETFLNEKYRLEELVKKKTSLEELIKTIEQDILQALSPPTLFPEKHTPPSKPLPQTPPAKQPVLSEEELQHRRATLASLRHELAELDDEIERQRPLADQSGLHDSIENVKEAVKQVFDNLALMEDVIASTDSDAASAFQSLEVDPPTLPLALQLDEIRKTAVEEKQLEIEAEKFHVTADILPDSIWEGWNTFYQEWKSGSATLKPGLAGIRARSKALRDAISDVSTKYREQVTSTLKDGIDSLIQQAGAIDTTRENGKLKAASLTEFKNLLVSARTASWQALINQCAEEPFDFARIKAIESQAAELKGADAQAIELFKPTPRGIMGWLWGLPSKFFYGDQEDPLSVFDSANRLFTDRINEVLTSLREYTGFIETTLYKDESVIIKGSDLPRFLMNASHDMEAGQIDPSIRLEIEDRIRKIQGLILLLPDLHKAHHQLFNAFAENQRNLFQDMLKDSANGQIRSAATAAINDIRDLSAHYPDLAAYEQNHPEIKSIATEKMALLRSLEHASSIYTHYNENGKILETRISTLTGNEKKLGEEALERFRTALESFQEIGEEPIALAERHPNFLLYTLPHAYNNLMIRAQNGVEAILNTEAKKVQIRDAIKREVKAYAEHIDQMLADLNQIEKRLGIILVQPRNEIQDSRNALVQKEKKCIVKPSTSRIPLLDRVRGAQFESITIDASEGTNVDDLSIADLDGYLQHIRGEIAREKDRIASSTYVERLKLDLQELDAIQKQANGRVAELTSGLRERGSDNQRLQKLQFYNASLLTRGIQNVKEQLDQLSKLDPVTWEAGKAEESKNTYLRQWVPGAILDNLVDFTGYNTGRFIIFLLQQLQSYKSEINDLLVRSARMESITLLDQIGRLDDDKSFQLQAKKAMLTLLEAKIKQNTSEAETLLNKLKTYGDLHKHAVGIVDDALISLDKKLRFSPLRGHAIAQFNTDGLQLGPIPPMPDIEKLTYAQFRGYEIQVNESMSKLQDELTHLDSAYDRAKKSEEIFLRKLQEAKKKQKLLDHDDQILMRNHIADVIAELEKNRADIANDDEGRSKGINAHFSVLGRILEFTKHSKVAGALSRFTDEMSDGTARLESTLREIERSKPMPLVKQLEITNIYDPVFTEVRARLLANTEQQLQLTDTELDNYSSLVSALPTEFFPNNNYLSKAIDADIQKKRNEIGTLRHTQITSYHIVDSLLHLLPSGIGSFISTRRPVDALSKSELIQYQHDIDKASKVVEQMEQMYPVSAFTEAYKEFDGLLKAVSRRVDQYKSEGQFYIAFLMQTKINDNKDLIEYKWKGRVNNKTDFETLKNELKAHCVLIRATAEDAKREASLSPSPLETQLDLLLAFRNRGGVDRAMLDRFIEDTVDYITTKVESSHSAYVNEMRALVGDERRGKGTGGEIEKICTIFNISGHLKNQALNAVLIDLNNVSSSGVPTFKTSENNLFPNRKTVKEMTLEEIVRVRPMEKITAASRATMNKLSQAFDFKALSSSYKAYTSAVEAAEKSQSKLLNDGQVLFSTELGETINIHKDDYRSFLSSLHNESDINHIISKLDDFTRQISLAEHYQLSRQSLTAVEQASQIPEDSEHRTLMSEALCIDLRKRADSKSNYIKLQKAALQQLYDALEMPDQWKKMISGEIEKNENLLEKALKPKNFNGKMVPIEMMTIDQLLVVDATVKNITTEIDAAFRRLNINRVIDQYKAYGRQLQKAQESRAIWLANSREDAVQRLDTAIASGQVNLHNFLLKPLDPNLNTNMLNLARCIHDVSLDISKDIFHISDTMPKTFGEMLRAYDVNSIDYIKAKAALKKSIENRLNNQRRLIAEELQNLQTSETQVNTLVQEEILDWKSTIPRDWINNVEEFFNSELSHLDDMGYGLRVRDDDRGAFTYVAFDQLNTEQLIEYETQINSFIEPIGKKKIEAKQLKSIQTRANLSKLKQELELFYKFATRIQSNASEAVGERKQLLELTLSVYVTFVSERLKNMSEIDSSVTLCDVLEEANYVLLQTIQYHENNITPPETPWILLKIHTEDNDARNVENDVKARVVENDVKTILNDGFEVGSLTSGGSRVPKYKSPPLKIKMVEIGTTIENEGHFAVSLRNAAPFAEPGTARDELEELIQLLIEENRLLRLLGDRVLLQTPPARNAARVEDLIISFDQMMQLRREIFNITSKVNSAVYNFKSFYLPDAGPAPEQQQQQQQRRYVPLL